MLNISVSNAAWKPIRLENDADDDMGGFFMSWVR